ncbi:MAG: PrgI family protein [Candidatus Paceibacterota bacterium]
MRFQVPQFIGVEDKVFGPLTIKQFIYVAGGGGLCFIIYRYLGFWFGLILMVPVAALAVALAFYKINNKPFVNILESAVRYFFSNHLYIWKKSERKPVAQKGNPSTGNDLSSIPHLSDSKLKDLTWNLDINQNVKNRE